MYSYSIIHIHTDPKFLYDVRRYQDKRLRNEVIFLGDLAERDLELLDDLNVSYYVLPKNKASISRAESLISKVDGVVLNGLCSFKEYLLTLLPKSTKVFLRFFGYEIYGQLKGNFMSRATIDAIYPICFNLPVGRLMKNMIKRASLKMRMPRIYRKKRSIYKKIDAIFLFSKEEYDELGNFLTLPPLIYLPIYQRQAIRDFDNIGKENTVIVGNSRIAWNNHLDILHQLKGICGEHKYNILMFFSYGANGSYATKVRDTVDSLGEFVLLEEFMNPRQFNDIYRKASAVVINSYRQHALGNIFTGIQYGCKIYLNEKSSSYKWLRNVGFLISNVSELTQDMISGTAFLSPQQQRQNAERLLELQNLYTPNDFAGEIVSRFEKQDV